MKILIIGSAGMLGADLAKVFSDHEVIFGDRDYLDITDRDAVMTTVLTERPEIIINAAAYNAVDDAETQIDLAHQINQMGPANLARAAQAVGALFIQYSTDYVFDGQNKDGYLEEAQPQPISVYGQSKLAGEKAVQEIGGNYYIVRTSRLFGVPAANPTAKKSFVDTMRVLAQTKTELSVVNEEVSSPTYTRDLALWTRKIIDGRYPSGIYHVINEGGCTWFDLAAEIFKILGKSITLTPVSGDAFPRPARRPAYSALINSKLPKLRSWQEALKDYLLNS